MYEGRNIPQRMGKNWLVLIVHILLSVAISRQGGFFGKLLLNLDLVMNAASNVPIVFP